MGGGGSLRTNTTKVSLLFAGETLACFHELRSLVYINLSGMNVIWGRIQSIRVSSPFAPPGHLPLFCCLGFLLCLQVFWAPHAQTGTYE